MAVSYVELFLGSAKRYFPLVVLLFPCSLQSRWKIAGQHFHHLLVAKRIFSRSRWKPWRVWWVNFRTCSLASFTILLWYVLHDMQIRIPQCYANLPGRHQVCPRSSVLQCRQPRSSVLQCHQQGSGPTQMKLHRPPNAEALGGWNCNWSTKVKVRDRIAFWIWFLWYRRAMLHPVQFTGPG